MRILNATQKTVICENAEIARTIFLRMKGLLGRASIQDSQALIITRCKSIHMVFMKFPIDVIFVDSKRIVVGLVRNIQPFQFSPYFLKADYVIECAPGIIDRTRSSIGDVIELIS